MSVLNLSLLSLLFWASSSLAALDNLPGLLLAASQSNGTALKPMLDNPIGTHVTDSSQNLIRGLLGRQSCSAGYGECTNPAGRCCPVGGRCCSGHGCCRSGDWCYAGGCCHLSEDGCEGNSCCKKGFHCCAGGGCCSPGDNCVVVGGRRGCCPIGQSCSGGGGDECEDPGYVPCSGESFCCPAGVACYRDSSNQPKCRTSGGGGGDYTSSETSGITYTSSSFGTSSTQTNISPSLTTQPASVIHSPIPSQGSKSSTVNPADDRIKYSSGWAPATSSCNSSTTCKKCVGDKDSFTFTFEGSAVYMQSTRNSDAGRFSVTCDNDKVTQDGYSINPVCGFTWAKTNLAAGTHTVVVNVLGKSPSALGSSVGAFELNSFVLIESDGAKGSSSTNGAVSNLHVEFYLAIFAGLVATLLRSL